MYTYHRGLQPLRWTWSGRQALGDDVGALPILISANAFGNGRPERDLIVSRQHRILIGHEWQMPDLAVRPSLCAAHGLTSLPGIREVHERRQVDWHHLMFLHHEIIDAQGCLTESLLPGPTLLKGMNPRTQAAMTRARPANLPEMKPALALLPRPTARRLNAQLAGPKLSVP